MNRHDDAERRVSAWLHDEAQGELPDWVLQQTFERTRHEAQRRGLRGRLTSITGTPTSAGSTTMFTIPRLAAVIAVTALATTAILNVSQTSNEPAGAEATRAPAVEFTGKTQFGDCFGPDTTVQTSPGFVRETEEAGSYCVNPTTEAFTDPRLGGEFRVWVGGNDGYGLGPTIWSSRFSMHDEDGAWVQRPDLTLSHADGSGPNDVVIMDGSGAYDGLSLIAEVSFFDSVWTWRGYIIDGDLPPTPEVRLPE